MNPGKYRSSLEESVRLLKKLELLGEVRFEKIRDLSFSKFLSSKVIEKQNHYYDLYRYLVENGLYDIILCDNSIFQFSFENGICRYAFYPNVDSVTYEEFLEEIGLSYREIGESFHEDYDIYLMQQKQVLQRVSVRYDYSTLEYQESLHSVSHFHFGSEKDLRIDSSLILTPVMFVLFIAKNYYFSTWKEFLKDSEALEFLSSHKELCEAVHTDFFSIKDQSFLYLK